MYNLYQRRIFQSKASSKIASLKNFFVSDSMVAKIVYTRAPGKQILRNFDSALRLL